MMEQPAPALPPRSLWSWMLQWMVRLGLLGTFVGVILAVQWILSEAEGGGGAGVVIFAPVVLVLGVGLGAWAGVLLGAVLGAVVGIVARRQTRDDANRG